MYSKKAASICLLFSKDDLIYINASLKSVCQGNKGRTQYQVWVGGKQCLEKFVDRIGAVGNYKQESLAAVKIYLENSGRASCSHAGGDE